MSDVDKGHIKLVFALENLLKEAKDFHFHDFKNTTYATPKVMLVKRLEEIREKVIQGDFDNYESNIS